MKFAKYGITRASKLTKKVCLQKVKQYTSLTENKKLSLAVRNKAKGLANWYKHKANHI